MVAAGKCCGLNNNVLKCVLVFCDLEFLSITVLFPEWTFLLRVNFKIFRFACLGFYS